MSLTNDDIIWYSYIYDNIEIIDSYGEFSYVSLLGTQGGINYNLALAIHQFGFFMKDKPNNTLLEGLFFQEGKYTKGLWGIMVHAWHNIHRKVKSEFGLKNCVDLEPYTSWVNRRAKEFKIPYAYEKPMSLVVATSPTIHIKGIEEFQEALVRMEQEKDAWEDEFHASNLKKIELQKELKDMDDLIELLEQRAMKRSRNQEDLFSSNISSSTNLPISSVWKDIVDQLVMEKDVMKNNYEREIKRLHKKY
ncbi:uncharacterized protein LOC127137975 [Lathyrus oleraceus]|uniref:uncharacterized protein LOC127137975 n=1 Tax=Pisum sativum TaxID=3888 RepID=UPI0021D0800D|nr:uncharacterized protein LOC127137975 [Pisum sativum]